MPGVALAAMQMGSHAGRMIEGDLRMRSRIPFHYRNKGALATIGRARAVADFGRVRFGGFLAWVAWLAIHIFYLIGFRNRVGLDLLGLELPDLPTWGEDHHRSPTSAGERRAIGQTTTRGSRNRSPLLRGGVCRLVHDIDRDPTRVLVRGHEAAGDLRDLFDDGQRPGRVAWKASTLSTTKSGPNGASGSLASSMSCTSVPGIDRATVAPPSRHLAEADRQVEGERGVQVGGWGEQELELHGALLPGRNWIIHEHNGIMSGCATDCGIDLPEGQTCACRSR